MNVGITVSDKKLQIFVMEIVVCMGISFHRQLETRKNSEKQNNQQRGMNECRKQKPFGGHISNGKCIRAEALRYFADLRRPSF